MEPFEQLYQTVIEHIGLCALYATILTFILFCIQLYYYLSKYGKLPEFRNERGLRVEVTPPPVSIVVVVRENTYYFIENGLQQLLSQDYHTYEVVVVDCSYDEGIGELLAEAALRHDNLHVTHIRAQNNLNHSIKLALTVGIKAAQYEHLIFTTADSYPSSDKWLALMAKGFLFGEVIVGYCGIEDKKGFTNKLIRCGRLLTSVRYLAAAIDGHPYRGISHNIGYTKSLYFANKGFDHLNMNIGDDDLFIQKIANRHNVGVVMNPNATMRQLQYGGLGWWHQLCKFYSYAFRYYPRSIRWSTSFELLSRFLFFIASFTAMLSLPVIYIGIPVGLLLLRELVVLLKTWRIGKRLGESGLMWVYAFHDLITPVGAFFLSINRRIFPNKAIWR